MKCAKIFRMAGGPLDYKQMMEGALRSLVREALQEVAENGLPDRHHFLIGFRTCHEGVVLPRSLLQEYPEDMTIVLQHQFWELEVTEEAFSVTLRFGSTPRRLTVPFQAVTSFTDPSVPFGLRFETAPLEEEPEPPSPPKGQVVPFGRTGKNP